jgi:DNA-directed RNA polymerase beta subunit
MGNQIIFPENNQLPRNLFSCGQSKQGVSLYHSNFQNRIDKMGVVLNYGQTPLVKSRYLKHINKEKHPYGENVIVAIMCLDGYNVEDSILFNKGSVDRGMFRTSYFNSYEAREESSKVKGNRVDSSFMNIQTAESSVVGLKPGYDYGYLDEQESFEADAPD